MGMRQQFTETMQYLSDKDERVITLLNDIGVFAFRNIKAKYPNRMHNLGIMEQASIGIAAGLSMTGYIPVFHTIAPFIVERGYEQLKDDFGYQNINGNFVTVGASYDYSALGMTHYCPGDVGALMQIPNMQITVPGTAKEFDTLLKTQYNNGSPTYYRLSEYSNEKDYDIEFGKAVVIKKGSLGTVIAVGPILDNCIKAVADMDVTLLYYTTVMPFDRETLRLTTENKKILLCEPYYYGGLTNEILKTFEGMPLVIDFVGINHEVPRTYGSKFEIDEVYGLTIDSIKNKASMLFTK